MGAYSIDWAAVEEAHQDGGKHWHVFLLFHNTFTTRNHKHFDLDTADNATLHPNIRMLRCTKQDLKNIWGYMNKTGAPLEGTWEWQEAAK